MYALQKDLFHTSIPMFDLAIRAVAVYFAVVILLRLGGKKQIGQLSGSEFVAVLLISNAVQNAMNGGDNSLSGGLVLASILVFLSWGISLLTFHSRAMSVIFEGVPTVLIHRGQMVSKNMRKERITATDLKILLRKQGIHHFEDVQTAILESDGSLSLTKWDDKHKEPPT